MKKTIPFLLIAFFALSGCSNKPYEKYLGLWQLQAKNPAIRKIMEIYRDGETILMINDILNPRRYNKKEVLTQSEGRLSLFGPFQFSLSEDEDTLHLGNRSFNRVEKSRIQKIKSESRTLLTKYEKDKKLCKDLDVEAKQKGKEIKDSNKWNKYVKELQKIRPKNCILIHDGKRY